MLVFMMLGGGGFAVLVVERGDLLKWTMYVISGLSHLHQVVDFKEDCSFSGNQH